MSILMQYSVCVFFCESMFIHALLERSKGCMHTAVGVVACVVGIHAIIRCLCYGSCVMSQGFFQ